MDFLLEVTRVFHILSYPNRFVSTGSFDGSILDYNYDNKVTPDSPSDLSFDQFPYLFGSDPDETLFRSQIL